MLFRAKMQFVYRQSGFYILPRFGRMAGLKDGSECDLRVFWPDRSEFGDTRMGRVVSAYKLISRLDSLAAILLQEDNDGSKL